MLIDMADISIGPSYYDTVQLYCDLCYSAGKQEIRESVEKTMGMPADLILRVWDSFISRYLADLDEEEKREYVRKLDLLNAVYAIPKSSVLDDETLAFYIPILKAGIIDAVIRPNLEEIKQLVQEGVPVFPD